MGGLPRNGRRSPWGRGGGLGASRDWSSPVGRTVGRTPGEGGRPRVRGSGLPESRRRASRSPPGGQVRVPGPSAPGPRGADLPGYSTGGRALLRPSALAKGCQGARVESALALGLSELCATLGWGSDRCVVPAAGIDRESDGHVPAGTSQLLPKPQRSASVLLDPVPSAGSPVPRLGQRGDGP